MLLVALLAIACDGGDGNNIMPPSESPAATSTAAAQPAPAPTTQAALTPAATNCPLAPDVCTFAREIERAVLSGDYSGIVTSARAEEITCPPQRLPGAGGPYPLCDGAPGERRQGYTIAYLSSEGVVVNRQGLQTALEGWTRAATPATGDVYGTGAPRLYTIGCPADRDACANQTAFVFSELSGVPFRSQLILYFDRTQRARAQLVWTVIGPLLDPQQLDVALSGGGVSTFLTLPGWPPITAFYRLEP
jgi:hypothetical protein